MSPSPHESKSAEPMYRHEQSVDDSLVIARLCEEYGRKRQMGDMLTVSEFVEQHTDVRGPLLDALNAMELLGSFQPGPRSCDNAQPPEQIAGCEVIREIGRGGMGIVYEARHPTVSRRLAIKLLNNRRGLKRAFRDRFRREAEAASRLTHPNIVPFIDCGEHEGTPYISMLYVDGESLDHALERHWDGQPLTSASSERQLVGADFKAIAQIGADAASALNHAHQQKAIHRDIKPANLILDADKNLWVADFGLAKLRDEDDGLSKTGDMIGTPRYMAPEQIRGVSDERSDIYSLGITLWELATGCRAWDNSRGSELITAKSAMQLPDIRKVHPTVPIALAQIVSRCCAFKPRNRYQTAAQLQSALTAFADEDGRSRGEDVSPPRAALTITCLLAMMLLAAYLIHGFGSRPKRSGPNTNSIAAAVDTRSPLSYASATTEILLEEGRVDIADLRLTASNPDGQPFFWKLVDSRDSKQVLVQQLAGTVCFVDPPRMDQPRDKDSDNIYELEFEASQTQNPNVQLMVESESGLELFDPRSGTSTRLSTPGNLQAITATDGTQFLHAHPANDGSTALFTFSIDSRHSFPKLVNSSCGLSPFVRDFASAAGGHFVAVEESRTGFELHRLNLKSEDRFEDFGIVDRLSFVQDPVGIDFLSDSDLLIIDRQDDSSLRLFEVATAGDKIVSYQELPTGWTCDRKIRGMVCWLDRLPQPSHTTRKKLVRIKIESASQN